MPGPTLTAAELAAELGREVNWIYANWRELAANKKLPRPLHGGTKPLAWSRAHVYAYLDKDLPAALRANAAAIRAAAAAAAGHGLVATSEAQREDDWRDKLDRQFGSREEAAS